MQIFPKESCEYLHFLHERDKLRRNGICCPLRLMNGRQCVRELLFDKFRLMLLSVGGQGTEDIHPLRQSGYINICLSRLQYTLSVDGVNLCR